MPSVDEIVGRVSESLAVGAIELEQMAQAARGFDELGDAATTFAAEYGAEGVAATTDLEALKAKIVKSGGVIAFAERAGRTLADGDEEINAEFLETVSQVKTLVPRLQQQLRQLAEDARKGDDHQIFVDQLRHLGELATEVGREMTTGLHQQAVVAHQRHKIVDDAWHGRHR